MAGSISTLRGGRRSPSLIAIDPWVVAYPAASISMFHAPAARPRTAHLPLLSVVTSGPPLAPFWIRSLTVAPLTGAPVFLSTTTPESRLLPRQSSDAASEAATSRSRATGVSAFFKLDGGGVVRSTGWHSLEADIGDSSVSYYVDGILSKTVDISALTDRSLDTVKIGSNLTSTSAAYFDDVYVERLTVPEPSVLSFGLMGGIWFLARRRKN